MKNTILITLISLFALCNQVTAQTLNKNTMYIVLDGKTYLGTLNVADGDVNAAPTSTVQVPQVVITALSEYLQNEFKEKNKVFACCPIIAGNEVRFKNTHNKYFTLTIRLISGTEQPTNELIALN